MLKVLCRESMAKETARWSHMPGLVQASLVKPRLWWAAGFRPGRGAKAAAAAAAAAGVGLDQRHRGARHDAGPN